MRNIRHCNQMLAGPGWATDTDGPCHLGLLELLILRPAKDHEGARMTLTHKARFVLFCYSFEGIDRKEIMLGIA